VGGSDNTKEGYWSGKLVTLAYQSRMKRAAKTFVDTALENSKNKYLLITKKDCPFCILAKLCLEKMRESGLKRLLKLTWSIICITIAVIAERELTLELASYALRTLAGSTFFERKSSKKQNVSALVQSFIYSIDYSCIIYIITPSHTLPLQNHL
jgi:hypothetical protein